MLRAHLVEDIRSAEVGAAELFGWDGLMQRAANALADRLGELVPANETVLFLIGPGNNGGDGLFAAARLCGPARAVQVCLLDPERAHTAGLAAALGAGAELVEEPADQRWVVDALFGIGSTPGLKGRAANFAAWAEETRAHVISVDVPSGIGVDTGTVPGAAFAARHTVTFGTRKLGLLAGPASLRSGDVDLVDIGLADYLGQAAIESLEFADGSLFAQRLRPETTDHKYTRGVLGVLAGSMQYPGAAHLCVAGALSGPTSMVRFLGERGLADRVIDRNPEVVAEAGQVQAFVVGSGGPDEDGPVNQALAAHVPLVIDAAGLSHLPARFELDALLTPHAGELAGMLDCARAEVEADPVTHAQAAARRWNATVLLKGPRTIIASPDGRLRVNLSGTAWLATAGAGDVLAGFAGSLLAAGLDAFDAGSLAALLHGIAAERVNPGGPITASGVARALPLTLADFLQGAEA